MNNIILFSRDPGGANCIAAVYDRLQHERKVKSYLWGKDFAITKYREWQFNGRDVSRLTPSQLRSLVQFINPQLILTGTSYGDYSEQNLWQLARDLYIPSAAIIDQWLSYRLRFTSQTSQLVTPDHILVMDNFAKTDMIQAGFDKKQLIIVGHPYLDFLREKADSSKKDYLPGPLSLLFISEPIEQAKHLDLGYTEKTILDHLIKALTEINLSRNIKLVIKLHPKNDFKAMKSFINQFSLPNFHNLSIATSTPLPQLILNSDLVIGMYSMGLIEAYILGKLILSVQIGLNQPDEFILTRRGITRTISSPQTLTAALNQFFTTGKVDYKKRFPIVSHARDNIINFILDTVVKSKPYATASH